MLPLLPIAFGALIGGAYLAKRRSDKKALQAKMGAEGDGIMTPERQTIYEAAMNESQDPAQIIAIAVAFDAAGLPDFADRLRKRAALRSLPPDLKAARRAAFKQAMNSKNKEGILSLANAFEAEGATGSAEALRKYASGLES